MRAATTSKLIDNYFESTLLNVNIFWYLVRLQTQQHMSVDFKKLRSSFLTVFCHFLDQTTTRIIKKIVSCGSTAHCFLTLNFQRGLGYGMILQNSYLVWQSWLPAKWSALSQNSRQCITTLVQTPGWKRNREDAIRPSVHATWIS